MYREIYAQCIRCTSRLHNIVFGSCAAVVVQIMRLNCVYKYTKYI